MATERQVAANRQNGRKGGVKTEEGKSVSRLNARKHGIFAVALTPEDSEECSGIEDDLIASMRPVGRVEEMLVEKIALTYLRMQRCARAEAEFHVQTWEEPHKVWHEFQWEQLQKQRGDGMRAVPFKEKVFERMVKLIDLYDSRLTNQWLKLLHEIERLQRLRKSRAPESEAPADAAPPPLIEPEPHSRRPAVVRTGAAPRPDEAAVARPQPSSPVHNGVPASSQPEAPAEETPESSQLLDALECVIPWPGEKTNPIVP